MRKQTDTFSIDAAASMLGYDRRTVARALNGLKADANSAGRKKFLLRTVVTALLDHERRTGERGGCGNGSPARKNSNPDDLAAERRGLIKARRIAAENENRRIAGELVEIDLVTKFLEQEFTIVKERFLIAPGAHSYAIADAARECPDLQSAVQVVMSKMQDVIYEALEELSDPEKAAEQFSGLDKKISAQLSPPAQSGQPEKR